MNETPVVRVCRSLRLRQFRNFRELELDPPASGFALIGDNGSGKTNLVEAIYYLEIFRSFRGSADEQLVRFGEEAFHLRGRFHLAAGGAVEREIAAAFERRGHRKRVAVNGTEPERLGDALGQVGAVVFSPSDLALVAGAPGERRRFLDIVLSLNRPGYLAALQRYRHLLRQRNAVLRGGTSGAALAPWDEGLVEVGARLMAERADWIAEHAAPFRDRYARISGGMPARLTYRPAVPLPDRMLDRGSRELRTMVAADAFAADIRRLEAREREQGMTLTGPHRDDIAFVLEGEGKELDLREFGSGGQQRTAAVVLRMVEALTVRSTQGVHPLILLDDLFAELDPGRSRRILELLEDGERGQVVLTAPKPSDLEPRRGQLPHWRITNGKVFT